MAKTRNTIDQSASVDNTTAEGLTDFGFTAAQAQNTRLLIITSDQPIRYLTSSTPTSSLGHYIAANDTVEFRGPLSEDFKFIAVSTTANLVVTIETFTPV